MAARRWPAPRGRATPTQTPSWTSTQSVGWKTAVRLVLAPYARDKMRRSTVCRRVHHHAHRLQYASGAHPAAREFSRHVPGTACSACWFATSICENPGPSYSLAGFLHGLRRPVRTHAGQPELLVSTIRWAELAVAVSAAVVCVLAYIFCLQAAWPTQLTGCTRRWGSTTPPRCQTHPIGKRTRARMVWDP